MKSLIHSTYDYMIWKLHVKQFYTLVFLSTSKIKIANFYLLNPNQDGPLGIVSSRDPSQLYMLIWIINILNAVYTSAFRILNFAK